MGDLTIHVKCKRDGMKLLDAISIFQLSREFSFQLIAFNLNLSLSCQNFGRFCGHSCSTSFIEFINVNMILRHLKLGKNGV